MKKTIIWILYILMGVQIVLGCAWLVSNFGTEQPFRENIVSSVPMEAVCILQLSLAAIAVWYVLGQFGFQKNKYLKGYMCAFLLTIPYLLQMHMARLIWSVSLSVFLWLFGLMLETMKRGLSKKRTVRLVAAYALYGVVCPDGLWLGGILLLAVFFFSGKNVRFGFATVLMAGVIFTANRGLNDAFPELRSVYRENNIGMAVISRFVWPNFGRNYYFWTEEIKDVLSEEEAVEISMRSDLVKEVFYSRLESAYGRKKAVKLCLGMGARCLKDRTRENMLEIGRDLKDYFLLPFTIGRNLKGEGVSLTAWNYGKMRIHTPILTKYYYRYGVFELPFLLLGSFLIWGFQKNGGGGQWKFLFFTVALFTVWYTMRSNFPIDYKMALPILFCWYLASAGGLLCGKNGKM